MKITIDNYQEFVADWLDGTLDPSVGNAFAAFLAGHPQIRAEIESIAGEAVILTAHEPAKQGFTGLKKSVNDKEVNAENFLEFVMARMDGELNESSLHSLVQFLQQHPNCQKEAKLFELTQLQPDTSVEFDHKTDLKRSLAVDEYLITPSNLEEIIIALLEGDLNEAETTAVQAYLATHPEAMALFAQYEKVKLAPDLSIRYPYKSQLQKKAVIVMFTRQQFIRTLAVAASIVLLAGIFLLERLPERGPLVPDKPILADLTTPQEQTRDLTESQTVAPSPSSKTAIGINRLNQARGQDVIILPQETTLRDDHPLLAENVKTRSVHGIGSLPERPTLHPTTVSGHAPGLAMQQPPRKNKLTIEEFSIENIRYFTGGGNERPGLLAELTLPKIAEATNSHQAINSAGQTLYVRWTEWKTRVLDEIIPYR